MHDKSDQKNKNIGEIPLYNNIVYRKCIANTMLSGEWQDQEAGMPTLTTPIQHSAGYFSKRS